MEGHCSTREGLKLVSTPITSEGLIEEFTWKCREGMICSWVLEGGSGKAPSLSMRLGLLLRTGMPLPHRALFDSEFRAPYGRTNGSENSPR
ncbi:hypothetical protein GCM10023086_68030 [Streptomyces venetus]|uniref:Uncharacterized protein n=1 Tax=Streptomyces venetus TaxID=1701086 RepID=A0ABP8H7P3_9ACTN